MTQRLEELRNGCATNTFPSLATPIERLKYIGGSPKRAILLFRITLLFITAYAITSLVYSFIFRTLSPPTIDVIITAPFSPYENFVGYSSPRTGFFYNFAGEAYILAFSEGYARIIQGETRRFDWVDSVLFLSVLASVLMSALLYLIGQAPSSGTSIIGFCITLSLITVSLTGMISELRRPKREQRRWFEFANYAVALIGLTLLLAFFTGAKALRGHILGAVLFIPMFTLASALRKSENSYVFVSIIILVNLIVGFPTLVSILFQGQGL